MTNNGICRKCGIINEEDYYDSKLNFDLSYGEVRFPINRTTRPNKGISKLESGILIMQKNLTNRKKALSPNTWNFSTEIWKALGVAKNTKGLNLNLFAGCSNNCTGCKIKYMFNRMIKPRTGTPHTIPIFNPKLLELLPGELEEIKQRDKINKTMIICSSITDVFLPGVLEIYIPVFTALLDLGFKITMITKTLPHLEFEEIFQSENPDKFINLGIGLMSTDKKIIEEQEPGASSPKDRIKLIQKYHKFRIKNQIKGALFVLGNSQIEIPEIDFIIKER